MKALQAALKDKSANNIVVGLLLGFGTVNFISQFVDFWNQGPSSYWHGQIWRAVIIYAVVLLVAELVARLAK